MKNQITLIAILVLMGQQAFSATKSWTFTYVPKTQQSFPLTFAADSKAEAFKMASKECFRRLTAGQYPGEEKGLEYIDICANPKM